MNDEIILNMLSEITESLDYDLWKQVFDEECIEDAEMAKERRDVLVEIVKRYL